MNDFLDKLITSAQRAGYQLYLVGGDVLLVGRDGHPFRRRERRQLLALARIADRVGEILPGPG
jgi:hypothetical protein